MPVPKISQFPDFWVWLSNQSKKPTVPPFTDIVCPWIASHGCMVHSLIPNRENRWDLDANAPLNLVNNLQY